MRSGSVGNHNLPFFWAGDNESNFGAENGLPSVVMAGLNAGLSGIPLWTSDLGGYEKDARTPGDDVLFVRWTEFSAFSPVMQLHSAINLGPWDYGAQALDIFRRYSRLHMSLFPYRYAAAQESRAPACRSCGRWCSSIRSTPRRGAPPTNTISARTSWWRPS